ncbi:MAG TPA: S46 family peptidase, partial [Rhodothermales bacterium]
MKLKISLPLILAAVVLASGCATTGVQQAQDRVDTVYVALGSLQDPDMEPIKAGRFDMGKMWTFDKPPLAHIKDTYGFSPDNAWFTKARTGALRLSNCTASFVSPNGLVLTNHHCARVAVTRVTRRGEDLATTGFYAQSLDDERRVRDFYADQLVSITDVTAEIEAAIDTAKSDQEREGLRQGTIAEIQTRLLDAAGGAESGHHVQIISLYSGSIYSAYTFKRYEDVRLVQSPELALGFFGGDPDNFTYPRYSLDMSFFRVYDGGRPLRTPVYFKFSEAGSSDGDPVFVVGNPGTTNRLQTLAELNYRREHADPIQVRLFETRARLMNEFMEEHPRDAQAVDLQNTIFSIENTIKARRGMLDGLRDPELMARKADAEVTFRAAIAADSALSSRYGRLFDEMASLHAELATFSDESAAYMLNPASTLYAGLTKRAALAYLYSRAIAAGASPEQMGQAKQQVVDIVPYPLGLEKKILAQRIEDLIFYLGPDHADVTQILKGRTPEQAAS